MEEQIKQLLKAREDLMDEEITRLGTIYLEKGYLANYVVAYMKRQDETYEDKIDVTFVSSKEDAVAYQIDGVPTLLTNENQRLCGHEALLKIRQFFDPFCQIETIQEDILSTMTDKELMFHILPE